MRRFLVALTVLASVGIAPRGAPAGDEPQEIKWDKLQDAFTTPNRRGQALESRGGTCNGDQELEFAWARAREKDPSLPPLAQVEQEILARQGATGGQEYLQKIRELAQRHSYRAGGGGVTVDAPQGKTPSADETIAAAKAAVDRGEPTRLLLSGTRQETDRNGQVVEKRVFHTVTAYQTAEAGGTTGLRVADSSAPGSSGVLVIDDKTGVKKGWEEVTEGDLGKVKWDRVDRITSPPGDAEVYRKLLDSARRGVPAHAIESGLGLDRVPPPTTSAVIADPKAGGVWIAFDPAAYATEDEEGAKVTEETIDAWVEKTQAFLESGGGSGLALSTEERSESAFLVSLKKTLASGAKTLAPLTRVHGYVLAADGDVWLAGLAEEGREPVPLDLLTFALKTVWRKGSAPFVSLDPDPKNLVGPPKPRTGDVPADLLESAYVRILFAADYAMKEIVLGARKVEVEDYRSLRDLLAERQPKATQVVARMWLTPLSAPVADVLETRREAATAVWFQSRVQALSEQMLLGAGGMVGTGGTDPLFAEAAATFTKSFSALAERIQVFRRLEVAFDLAKACAIWRARGVTSPVLDEAANRTPASGEPAPEDEPKRPFPGVGILPVEGTDDVLSGGARAKARVRPKGVVTTDRLAPLLDAAASGNAGPVEIAFPAVMDLDAAAVAGAEAELSLSTALALMRGGEGAKAVESLTRVLDADPSDPEAWMFRGLANLQAHHDAEGRTDLDRAVALDPKVGALRGFLRVSDGERDAGLADVTEAERAAPDDERTLAFGALARVRGLDFANAERDLRRLTALAPAYPAAEQVRSELDLWRSLTRAQAEQRLRQVREVPDDVQRLLLQGGNLMEADPKAAIPVLSQALALAEASPAAAVKELHVPERLRFLIGLASLNSIPRPADMFEKEVVEEAAGPARDQAAALIAAHPDWPSGYLLRSSLDANVNSAEDAWASFALAFDRAANRDPILDDMAPQWGSSSMVAMLGTSVAWSLWERGLDASPVLDRCGNLLHGASPSKALAVLARHPEVNLAKFIERRGRWEAPNPDALKATLAVLREAEAALDSSPAKDGVAQWFLQVFHKAYLPLEQEVGGDWDRLLSSSVKFLASTEGVEPRPMFAEPIYSLRAAACGMAAAAVAGGATDALRTTFENVGKGMDEAVEKGDAKGVLSGLHSLAAGVRSEFPTLRAKVTSRCDDVAKAAGSRAKDAVVLMLASTQAQLAGKMGSSHEVERLEAVPGVKGSAELAEYVSATEDARKAGIFVADDPKAVLDRVVATPANAAEGETLLHLLPMLKGLTADLFPGGQSPVDFDAAIRELKFRLKLAAFAEPPSGSVPAGGPGTSPSFEGHIVLPSPSAPVWLIPAIVTVVLLTVATVVVVVRSRRRKSG